MSLIFGSPVDEFLEVANTGTDSIITVAWKFILFSDLMGDLAPPGDRENV